MVMNWNMNKTIEFKLELVMYRDAGMATYTFFWVDKDNKTVGPYFDTEEEANDWLKSVLYKNNS